MVNDEPLARHYPLQGIRNRTGAVLLELQSVYDGGEQVRAFEGAGRRGGVQTRRVSSRTGCGGKAQPHQLSIKDRLVGLTGGARDSPLGAWQ